jgi:hypothetical protein
MSALPSALPGVPTAMKTASQPEIASGIDPLNESLIRRFFSISSGRNFS